jgi:hypothetical protein
VKNDHRDAMSLADTFEKLADRTIVGWFPSKGARRKPLPKEPGFWSVDDRMPEFSTQGDPLEKLLEIVDVVTQPRS